MNQNIQRAVGSLVSPPSSRPALATQSAGVADMMTPKEIVGILRRHIWMILISAIAGMIIGTGLFFLLKRVYPRYSTRARIEVLPSEMGDPLGFVNAQPQKDTYYQHRFSKAAMVKQQDLLQELLQQDDIRQTDWFKQFAQTDEQGNIIGDRDLAIKDALDDLDKNLIANAPRDFVFIEIGMTCGDPKDAAKITNKITDLFLASQRNFALGSIRTELSEKTRQQTEIRNRLEQIESSQLNIRKGTPYAARLNLSENTNFRDYMDDKISDIERSYSSLESEKSNLEKQIENLKIRAGNLSFDDIVHAQVEQDAVARQLRTNINTMESVLAQRLSRFGEEHREVREARGSLKQFQIEFEKRQQFIGDTVRQANLQQAEENMTAMVKQLETITKQLQAAHLEYRAIEQTRSEYDKYEKKRTEQQDLLKQITGYIEKLTAQSQNSLLSRLNRMGSAPVPLEMNFPQLKLFLPAGLILGLLAGIGLAFAVELLNDRLRTPSDVARHLRIPLLGSICHSDDDEDIEGVDLSHVVRQAPYSITSECYRQLRTNMKLSGPMATEHKTILITSPAAGDGKTSVAVNLAATTLHEGKRVLLIDANFRRPSSGLLFPRTEADGSVSEHADSGLSNYLMGQCADEKEIIRSSGIEGMDIIDSGPLPANPAELVGHPRMKQLLERTKQLYDYVIVDGPALLVSDGRVLASQVDGTLVVFNADTTHRGMAQRVLRELQNVHANTVGTVLMAVKIRKGGYFREVYRSYQEYQRVPVNQSY
jgi:capsular exopolysaccharide synthesis family protein